MEKHRIPGLSIAITKSERLVFAKGYGFADDTSKEQVNPRHRFRIASISKPVTAIAVMELVETLDSGLIDRNVFGPGAVLGTQYGSRTILFRGKGDCGQDIYFNIQAVGRTQAGIQCSWTSWLT